MADVAPLKPLRYSPQALPRVVAPPYDVISADERGALAARDPHNVVKAEGPEGEGDAKYAHAAELLDRWVADRALTRDERPGFFRYDQSFESPADGRRVTRTGFLALVRLVPFSDRVVLPHERTLSGPKEDRLKLFRATRTNLSPGFMLYRDPQRALDSALAGGSEVARFTTQAATEATPIENALMKIERPDALRAIVEHVGRCQLLIADGHHRYETALHYSREVESKGVTSPRAEHKWFMAFLANEDDPGLLVLPTHRLVKGLAGPDGSRLDDVIAKVRDVFEVTELPRDGARAYAAKLADSGKAAASVVAIDRSGRAVLLRVRADFDAARHPTLGARPKALRGTDVAILHAVVLEHALGVSLDAQAKQSNLVYLKDGVEAVRKIGAGEGDLLFLMNATPVAQVRAVAEEGEVMPQKATYFYPKVLTGLAIHTLHPTREVADARSGVRGA